MAHIWSFHVETAVSKATVTYISLETSITSPRAHCIDVVFIVNATSNTHMHSGSFNLPNTRSSRKFGCRLNPLNSPACRETSVNYN
jgi:hypothetical protein